MEIVTSRMEEGISLKTRRRDHGTSEHLNR